jgi:pimeloyl-ACP methyl ester carboxylesterase
VAAKASPFNIQADGVALSGEAAGEGTPVVMLHGLSATRRYVVMGSTALARSGHRVLSYDARGHGASAAPGDRRAYGYELLASDLAAAVDALSPRRAVVAGVSMGAHTAIRFALAHPERVAALTLITPAFEPAAARSPQALARWDALAEGLRSDGVEGFVRAYDFASVAPPWRAIVEKAVRQRLAAHAHPLAVADALEAVPRSLAFEHFSQLSAIRSPTVVVGSRDEADPDHPLATARRYAEAIPCATLVVEQDGSPIAWQGGRISRVITELASRVAP